MSGAALSFDSATVRYEGAAGPSLDGVSIDIRPQELLVLVGPSGCGKTTLLRSANALVPLTSGSVEIDGVDVRTLDPVQMRRSIGYAIQAVGLFPHMSVAENVAVVPSLLRWDRKRIGERVDDMLALVRLDPARYRGRRPRELSGGEAQRVGVARALAAEPRLLLMDEPFGALDALVRAELQAELREIVRRLGTTTLFVTHDVNEALRLADRIAVLRLGRLEQIDAPIEILRSPGTPFVRALFAEDRDVEALRAAASSAP